jgi:hypothetical protein
MMIALEASLELLSKIHRSLEGQCLKFFDASRTAASDTQFWALRNSSGSSP